MHRATGARGAALHVDGEIGPGALYTIDVPTNWNGDLVVYAHGYVQSQLPVGLPQGAFPGVRDQLVSRGYAVAATSFSENGYAEAEGARQVHQLRGIFSSRVGAPSRTFLVGLSLGALISTDLLQTHPEQYTGALAVSGPLGGTAAEFNYVGDVRALWDLLLCDLPGTFTDIPPTQLPVNDIVGCIQTHPQQFGILVSTWRAGGMRVAGRNPNELATSVVQTLGFDWYGFADGMDRTQGHMPYDNHDALYTSPVVPAAVLQVINGGIARYTATPDANAYMRHHYEPSGTLQRPLLTIHAEQDPLVPWGHEGILLTQVTAAGNLGNLSQSHYDRFGHTEAFTDAEVAIAFDALVSWVNTGVKPTDPISLGP
jgi:pimeloyl-ACP methyl ester carboxylesterase